MANFCPEWIISASIASAATGFLESETPLLAFSTKFSTDLSKRYNEIPRELIDEAAQKMLEFLSEIEAGEIAVEYLKGYVYRRLKFSAMNKPRKFTGMFSNEFTGTKTKDYSAEKAVTLFKAFVFSSRSGIKTEIPAGWLITDIEGVDWFGELVISQPNIFDAL